MINALRTSKGHDDSQRLPVSPDSTAHATGRRQQRNHSVTLDLTDNVRYAILINALQDYASDALGIAQREDSTTAERDHFQSVAATATELLNELG